MAYTLNSSGIATNLIGCVGVQEGGGSIVDFTGKAITAGTGVTASISTGTWKGNTRGTFATTANGPFNFFGITWNTPPTVDEADSDGMSVFCAFAGSSANSNGGPWVQIASGNASNAGLAPSVATPTKATYIAGVEHALTTTTIPTDGTTKFSMGFTYRSNVSSTALYGLESGSMSQEASAGSDGGFGGSRLLNNIGGSSGNGNQPARYFIACVFNRILTTAEMQSLHGDGTNDWFSTLFNAPAGGTGARLVGGKLTDSILIHGLVR